MKVTFNSWRARTALALATGALMACGSEKDANSGGKYALQTFVYQPDDSTLSYVALTDTLDLQGDLRLANAHEFPGYSFIASVGGDLLLSSGETPEITKYAIDGDGSWNEVAKVNFSRFGVPSFGAGFERHWFLNENVAYLTHEISSRIVWDPTEMVIRTLEDDTQLAPSLDGLALDAPFNRPPLMPEGPVLKPFVYHDDDWFLYGAQTSIAVYDPETHAERAVLDVPCPALEVMSQDEEGNTYFSPWTYGPALGLFGEGPETCIRRVTSDSALDADWTPKLSEWTGGRPVQVFRYVRDGKALGTVLHLDEVEGDFSAGYDEELALSLDGHWRLWEFDLVLETARPVPNIGSIGSGFNMTELEGRTFVFVPNEEWTATTVYELALGADAEQRFTVPGVLNNWIKLR